jgi:hypothetical protein
MPKRSAVQKAKRARREGKAPTTQAGEFVREEIEHIRAGKHGARSTKQAIAIGLSKARRAGVDLPPQQGDEASRESRRSQAHAYEAGHGSAPTRPHSRRRARGERSEAARKAARTKGATGRAAAARKAARTRRRHARA